MIDIVALDKAESNALPAFHTQEHELISDAWAQPVLIKSSLRGESNHVLR